LYFVTVNDAQSDTSVDWWAPGRRLSAAHTNTDGARSNNAAELRRRSYEAVTDAQSFDTTLRSFNARAGLLTEL
jgi:hypothetical protein